MKHASVGAIALALLAFATIGALAQTIEGCEDVSNADLFSLQTGILTCLSVDLDSDTSVCPGTCSNALDELDSSCLNGLINYAVDTGITSTPASDLTDRLNRLVVFCGLSLSEEESDDLVAEESDIDEAESPVSAPVSAPSPAPADEDTTAPAPGPSAAEDDSTVSAQDNNSPTPSPSPSPSSAAAGRRGLVAAMLASIGALVVLV